MNRELTPAALQQAGYDRMARESGSIFAAEQRGVADAIDLVVIGDAGGASAKAELGAKVEF